ncbi:MAG: SDR family NAD(P)-dependent oxidoreductase [Phenylobacterium sp.]|uniref:SDR family NAD(P)-dependent oxidoreductase n=1 Tax=Phenylobacterium sp. TaxID=1871053 RepID=UPI001A39A427|nr:SDR family NAD(P)-dependent oxidoreductase [Phenylobacterium sp.]MBL8770113.1 SDR family NAD(P)-dependent oxidoreductase [Phenylobacterium sp.]
MSEDLRPLSVVTGASSGIGYELAMLCAEDGHDLIVVADRPEIVEAAQAFEAMGVRVQRLMADLATLDGVDRLLELVGDRPVDHLLANAGHGLGHAFLEQPVAAWRHVIDTNVTGTLYLVQRVARPMVERGRGRILFTGSIAGLMPGTFQAVYNGTKAFIDSFAWALRNELKDTGVSVTTLLPGATDTEFFERAGMQDTKVGQGKKDDPADVARTGYNAMMKGEGDVVHGLRNKVQAAMAAVTPESVMAEQHRKMAEPGTGDDDEEIYQKPLG